MNLGNHSSRMVRISWEVVASKGSEGSGCECSQQQWGGRGSQSVLPPGGNVSAGALPPHLEPQLLEECACRHRLCVESSPSLSNAMHSILCNISFTGSMTLCSNYLQCSTHIILDRYFLVRQQRHK